MANARAERVSRSAPPPPPPPPDGPETVDQAPVNGAAPANTAPPPAAAPAPPEQTDPFLFMRQFDSEEWRAITGYLYRTAPITNKRGAEVNIQVFQSPVDQDDVMKTHGSGDYRIDLNIDRPGGGGRKRLRQFYFSILNPDYPPRIPLSDWVDDARNERWAWAKATAVNGITGGQPQGGTQMSQEALLRFVFEQVEKNRPNIDKGAQENLATKIVSMVEHNQQKMMELADPSRQLSTLKTLLEAIAPNKGASDPLLTMLLEDRKAMRDEATELRRMLMERPKEKGFLEQLIENEGALQKVRGFFGGGGSTKTDWGQVALEGVTKLVEGLAPIGVAYLTRAPGGGPGAPGSPAPSWPPQAPAVQQPRRQPAATAIVDHAPQEQPAAAAAETGDQGPEEPMEQTTLSPAEQAMLMQSLAKYGTLIQQCIPFLVDQYRAGLTGYDFRDWFISRHGMNWWSSMRTELKADGLLLAAKYDPALWAALQPEEKARQFFEEMFTAVGDEQLPASDMMPDEDDDDEEEDTLPVGQEGQQ